MNYPIDKELIKRKHILPPFNKVAFFFASVLLKIMHKPFNKKLVDVKYIKVGRMKIHIITPIELLDKDNPCLFYIHGGGFVFRASKGHYLGEQAFALAANYIVVGIDYDLTPKYPYPIAINECVEAYEYLINHHKELHIDINHMVIGGDSSGGNLAIETYLRVKDMNNPKGLMLIYPSIDNNLNRQSMKKYDDTPCWNNKLNKKMWEYYLKGQEYVSPIDRVSKFNINNIYVELCEFDPLHDEGYDFYQALKGRVDNLILMDTKGTFHGYDVNFKAKVCIKTFNAKIDFLKQISQE